MITYLVNRDGGAPSVLRDAGTGVVWFVVALLLIWALPDAGITWWGAGTGATTASLLVMGLGCAASAVRRIAAARLSCSAVGRSWPMPSTSSSSLPRSALAVARPPEGCTILSARPCTTRAGRSSAARRGPRSGWVRMATIWRRVPPALTPWS